MSYPITTTLNRIYAQNPCPEVWQRGLSAAGKTAPDDKPITYEAILEAVGIENAVWCCRAEPQHNRLWRMFAVWCARQVQHLMHDQRSIDVLDVAEAHAKGLVADEELDAARAAAWAAASDAQLAAFRQLVTTGTLPPINQ